MAEKLCNQNVGNYNKSWRPTSEEIDTEKEEERRSENKKTDFQMKEEEYECQKLQGNRVGVRLAVCS